MPDRIIRAQPHKPAKQHVVVQLLQQQPLGADPVERLQQRGQWQLLRLQRWPPFRGVELAEGGIEPIKRLLGQLPDLSPRLTARDPLHDRQVIDRQVID
jgi:hypothetical protein